MKPLTFGHTCQKTPIVGVVQKNQSLCVSPQLSVRSRKTRPKK